MPRSKKVSIKTFKKTPPDAAHRISGTYLSSMSELSRTNGTTTETWLRKQSQDPTDQNEQRDVNELRRHVEVFAAWQYEAFIGASDTQPEYLVIEEKKVLNSVATRYMENYTSFGDLFRTLTPEECSTRLQAILCDDPNNLKLLAQMVINFVWLAASDFKLDHIGINESGQLVCIDFGESLIPFQFDQSAYQNDTRQWNFTLGSEDISTAPFFTQYHSDNFFITRGNHYRPGVFDFLKDHAALKPAIYKAVLKRLIFPEFITFQASELLDDYSDNIKDDLKRFLRERTRQLQTAALNNADFVEYMNTQGQIAFAEIQQEILNGHLKEAPYFRDKPQQFIRQSQRELSARFAALTQSPGLAPLRQAIDQEAAQRQAAPAAIANHEPHPMLLFAMQHPALIAGMAGLFIAALIVASVFSCGAVGAVAAVIGSSIGLSGSAAILGGTVTGAVAAGVLVGALSFFGIKAKSKTNAPEDLNALPAPNNI